MVTTPVFNGEAYIDETILSVVTQTGPINIRYHVQDGGSTDGTLAKLEAWKARFAGGFPLLCKSLEFSFSSASDTGLYDAISTGFAHCGDGDLMTWINADDRLEPGAFAAVAQIMRDPSISWMCGRGALIDETGAIYKMRPITPYARNAIRAGVFDGRNSPCFIMQEGSFWRRDVWTTVGGLDPRYRLAGDFDLWRRFSAHADLVVVDAIFGYFRSHSGQLSQDIEAYRHELDDGLDDIEKARRKHAALRYRNGIVRHRTVTREYKHDWEVNDLTYLKIRGRTMYKIKTTRPLRG